MKFITESEIKFHYKKAPFKIYDLATDCRLTPEAKQFFSDHNIKVKNKEEKSSKVRPVNTSDQEMEEFNRISIFFNLIQTSFYETALYAKDIDSKLCQELLQMADILVVDNNDLEKIANIKEPLIYKKEAFKITYFQALSKYGILITKLAHLGSELELLAYNLSLQEQRVINSILTRLAWMIDQLMQEDKNDE